MWAGCGRIGFEASQSQSAEVDAGATGCESLALLSRDKPGTVIGTNFGDSSASEAVDGVVGVFRGYWACMLECSLIIDLESEQLVEELELWPGGNALPSVYYLQESWRVRYATESDPDRFLDFEGVDKTAGAGTLGTGISISDGWPPTHEAAPEERHPEHERYLFRVAPTKLRFVRFDGLVGDLDGDTNLDEIEIRGCSPP